MTTAGPHDDLIVDDGDPASTEGLVRRFPNGLFDEIDRALFRYGVVRGFGFQYGPDEQLHTKASLLHLPSAMARDLERFPADALGLSVRVAPLR